MDEGRLKELIEELRSTNEGVRLKATRELSTEKPDPVSCKAIPVLKELYWKDSNPAVKFLAKKALANLGENVSEVHSSGGEAIVPIAQRTGLFKLIPDGDILWKCAQEELRCYLPRLKQMIWSKNKFVQAQVAEALESLGTVLSAAPLIEALLDEQHQGNWQEEPDGIVSASYEDVKDLIRIAHLRHSGINPATAAAMGNLNCPEVKEAFIEMLRSSNPVLQKNAVKTLAELSDPKTIGAMISLLRGEDDALERKVIKTVSKIAATCPETQEAVLKVLLEHFRPSESEFTLYAIVEAMGRIVNSRTLDFLKKCLEHPLPRLRANAVEAISRFDIPDSELIAIIAPMLRDKNNRVVGNAIVALWGTSEQKSVLGAVERMAKHPNKWHRAAVAYALGEINTEESAGILIPLLRDSDEDVRNNSSKAMRKLDDPGAVSRLVEFINDDDLDVRLCAIEQIGKAKLDVYNDILLLILDAEQNPKVIATTLLALGKMSLPDNIPTISYYLNHDDDRVRANAIEALSHINDPKVMSLLSLGLSDSSNRVKANIIVALWKFGEIDKVKKLEAMLASPDARQAASGAYALGAVAIATRKEQNLINYPLLVAALRQHPKYNRLKQLLSSF
jgi:HEAT repeat protein